LPRTDDIVERARMTRDILREYQKRVQDKWRIRCRVISFLFLGSLGKHFLH